MIRRPPRATLDRSSAASDVYKRQHRVRLRPEVRLTEVPAPQRIAPYAVALTADVVDPRDTDDDLASGRFVLLHDPSSPCLLYTSDAADERSSVDLGGRRIIKKKNHLNSVRWSIPQKKDVTQRDVPD